MYTERRCSYNRDHPRKRWLRNLSLILAEVINHTTLAPESVPVSLNLLSKVVTDDEIAKAECVQLLIHAVAPGLVSQAKRKG